jgi:hypothetical protein
VKSHLHNVRSHSSTAVPSQLILELSQCVIIRQLRAAATDVTGDVTVCTFRTGLPSECLQSAISVTLHKADSKHYLVHKLIPVHCTFVAVLSVKEPSCHKHNGRLIRTCYVVLSAEERLYSPRKLRCSPLSSVHTSGSKRRGEGRSRTESQTKIENWRGIGDRFQ